MTSPSGITCTGTWNDASATATVEILSGSIAPGGAIVMQIENANNPASEKGTGSALITTRISDGTLVDGPQTINVASIVRGELAGTKRVTSTLPQAGRTGTHVLEFTATGRIPADGKIYAEFPLKWNLPTSPVVLVQIPQTGTTATCSCDTGLRTCTVQLAGSAIAAGSTMSLQFSDTTTPSGSKAEEMMLIRTTVNDGSVIDESQTIVVNAIISGTLQGALTWTSTITTPGIPSLQTIAFQLDGAINPGSYFTTVLPDDGWELLTNPVVGVTLPSGLTASSSWNSGALELQFSFDSGTAAELSNLEVTIDAVYTAASVKPAKQISLTLYDADAAITATTAVLNLNAINKGLLSGSPEWKPPTYTPGLVASLVNNAVVSFTCAGRIPANGKIVIVLPNSGGWGLSAVSSATFTSPSQVVGTVSWDSDRTLSIALTSGFISHGGSVAVSIDSVMNPPSIQSEGVLEIFSYTINDELIDEVTNAITAPIESILNDITSLGDNRVVVLEAAKTFTFVGVSISENDNLKFVSTTTLTDASCGTGASNSMGGVGVVNLGSTGEADISVTSYDDSNNQFYLCYQFNSNPYKLYQNFVFTVKHILSIVATEGSNEIAVAGYEKQFTVQGSGMATGDMVRWITSGVNCDDLTSLATVVGGVDTYTVTTNNVNQFNLNFDVSEAGNTIQLCYKFGREPYKLYTGITLTVRHVLNIEAAEGSKDIAVSDYSKVLTIEGSGVMQGDEAKWIRQGSTCSSQPALMVNDIESVTVSSALSIESSFLTSEAGYFVFLCYKFGAEPFHEYPNFLVQIITISSISSSHGNSDLVILNIAEELTFAGPLISENDEIRLLSTGADCSQNLLTLDGGTISTIPIASAKATVNVTSLIGTATLCYKFLTEPYMHYSNFQFNVADVLFLTAKYGKPEKSVVDFTKTLKVSGEFVATNDRISWTEEATADCSNLLSLIPESTGVSSSYSEVDAEQATSFQFDAPSSGIRAVLCYQFNNEPYKLYESIKMEIHMVTDLYSNYGSSSIAVVGHPKTFHFVGDGVRSGDMVKFVAPSTSCSGTQGVAVNTLNGNGNDVKEMALQLWESSPNIAIDTFKFIDSGNYTLCYKFDTEPYKDYDALRLQINSVS